MVGHGWNATLVVTDHFGIRVNSKSVAGKNLGPKACFNPGCSKRNMDRPKGFIETIGIIGKFSVLATHTAPVHLCGEKANLAICG